MSYIRIIKKSIAAFSILLFLIFLMYSLEREDSKEEPVVQNINYGLDFQLTYDTGKTWKNRTSLKENTKKSSNCENSVKLQNIVDFPSIGFGVFMMETSGLTYSL